MAWHQDKMLILGTLVFIEDSIASSFGILADVDDFPWSQLGLEVDVAGCGMGIHH